MTVGFSYNLKCDPKRKARWVEGNKRPSLKGLRPFKWRELLNDRYNIFIGAGGAPHKKDPIEWRASPSMILGAFYAGWDG